MTDTVLISGKNPKYNPEETVILSRTTPELKDYMVKILIEQGYKNINVTKF